MDTAELSFEDAVEGLKRGDFSRLEPLFLEKPSTEHGGCQILEWYDEGYFAEEPEALNESLTCACFLGHTKVAEFLLTAGVNPNGGCGTGLNAFHWASNRGHLETVKLLIQHHSSLEIENMYGGTVLSGTVWAAFNETKPNHLLIIELLLEAGARVGSVEYPTRNELIDEYCKNTVPQMT